MKGELQVIAAQYAEALLELVEESASASEQLARLERVQADLKAIGEIFATNEDFALVLNHPSLDGEEKKKLLIKTFDRKVDEVTLRLIKLLCDRRRLELLPHMDEPFAKLLREKKGIVGARLICSSKLSASELANIKARLTEHLGKKLELDVEVDESLLGGVILRLGDQVIDGSLKGRLQSLEKSLMSV